MPKDAVISKEKVTLLEILDRVLDKGVTITGDITISVADVDLVYIALRVLISSIETVERLKYSERESSGETTSVATGIGF